MKRTTLFGLFCALLCGCQKPAPPPSITFGDDLDFLRKYTEIVLLSDERGDSQAVLVPAYQGRVMTSTAGGVGGMSFGWINRDLIAQQRMKPQFNPFGGEDRLWIGPEGGQFSIYFAKGEKFDLDHWQVPASIDTEPFTVTAASRDKASFSRRCQLKNYSGTAFDLEIKRDVRLLDRKQVCRLLGLELPGEPPKAPPTATPATAPAAGAKPNDDVVKPAFGPATKPAPKPADKPAPKPADKPADKPAPKPADKPAPKPADKPVDVVKPNFGPAPAATKPVAPAQAAWPPPGAAILNESVKVVAVESTNQLVNMGKEPWTKQGGMLSIWILGMMIASPQNTVIAPYVPGPEDQLGPVVNSHYFEPAVPPDRLKVGATAVFFKADAGMRTKIGLSPRRARDVIGSYAPEHNLLTIVQYTKPKGVTDYVNSVWAMQKEPFAGDVLNSYSDGPQGFKSNFYELETSSPAAALKPKEAITHVHRTIHFQGPKEALDPIARKVLGVGLDEVEKAFAK